MDTLDTLEEDPRTTDDDEIPDVPKKKKNQPEKSMYLGRELLRLAI